VKDASTTSSSSRHAGTRRRRSLSSTSAPIVVEANGSVTTYPAVYLRQQEGIDGWERWGNHTPAWDDFVIQPEALVK
jgi:hypothetical protein